MKAAKNGETYRSLQELFHEKEAVDRVKLPRIDRASKHTPHAAGRSSFASSQPFDICTARSHFVYILSLVFLVIWGRNMVRSFLLISLSSSNSCQRSTAKPAAIAAPKDVVSLMIGRLTGIFVMSACVYMAHVNTSHIENRKKPHCRRKGTNLCARGKLGQN